MDLSLIIKTRRRGTYRRQPRIVKAIPDESLGAPEVRSIPPVRPLSSELPQETEPVGSTLGQRSVTSKPGPPIRQWQLGYPYTCSCGEPTGFSTDGVGLCPSCEFGPNEPPTPPSTRPKKRQVSCRAFKITKIHAVTRAELCLDCQGPHCSQCELRQKC